EIFASFDILVDSMSRLHVGYMTPYFRTNAVYAERDQPKKYKVQIMHNAHAVSAFTDERLITGINRTREQNQEGAVPSVKPPPITLLLFRQAVHQ
ncbi:unnamed protein product, partial [Prorocentrum cordatum]